MAVRFELPDPSLEDYTWVHDNEHSPASQPPLTLYIPGMEAPGSEAVPATLKVNGYSYWRMGASFGHGPVPSRGDKTPLQAWREDWLPRVDDLAQEMLAFEPANVPEGGWASALDRLDGEFGSMMLGVHVVCVFGAGGAANAFLEAHEQAFGRERKREALALLHGFENATTARAAGLWELGRLVRADPHLRAALGARRGGAALPDRAGFAAQLEAFLERWGLTVDAGTQDSPSWAENPGPLIAAILTQSRMGDDESPTVRQAAARDERARTEARLREAAASSEAAAGVLALLPAAQEQVVVSEDHNVLCDQRLMAASRRRWLRVGDVLVARGDIADPGDVFYFERPELIDVLERRGGVARDELARRRALQAEYRAAKPPPTLGRAASAAGERSAGAIVRGVGASAGVHRGRARVARTLAEAAELEAGEVLVCVVTSPAWTPIFAIAGAVVTDAGSVLSHPAVVAREFGIPAVVGTRAGTAMIPDGALVEVDGVAGEVRLA
jgi:pyruvate,water dikinase